MVFFLIAIASVSHALFRFNESMVMELATLRCAYYEKAPVATIGFDLSLGVSVMSFFALETGLAYIPKAFLLDEQKIQFAVFQVPLLVRFRLDKKISIASGWVLSRRIGLVTPQDGPYGVWKKMDVAWAFAVGFDQRVFEMLYIIMEARLYLGMMNQNVNPSVRMYGVEGQTRLGLGYDF